MELRELVEKLHTMPYSGKQSYPLRDMDITEFLQDCTYVRFLEEHIEDIKSYLWEYQELNSEL